MRPLSPSLITLPYHPYHPITLITLTPTPYHPYADGTAAHLDFREVKEEDQVIPRPAYLLGKQPVLGTSTFKGDKDELKGLGAAWGETVKGLPDTPQQVP